MRDRLYLGELEKMILLAILGLHEQADGTGIRKRLKERAGRDVSVGALYATMDRMEEKGFLGSEPGPATARTGNRSVKYFHVTGTGQEVLEESERSRERLLEGVTLRPVRLVSLEGGVA